MRLLLLILLFPSLALAVHDCEWEIPCDARINFEELKTAILAQNPNVDPWHRHCESAMRRADGTITRQALPRKIGVRDVPNAITCDQVKTFLINHNPQRTDQEQREHARVTRLDNELRALSEIDGTLLKQIITDINNLKGGSP